MQIKSMLRFGILIGLTLATSTVFAERFFNVSKKKVKVSVTDLNEDEIKDFMLAPMSHKILDLSQWKNSGISVVVKPLRSSLLEKKRDKSATCEVCKQAVE